MVRMPIEKKKSLNEREIEKLIDKGAAVKCDNEDKKAFQLVNVRIPTKMLEKIDEHLKNTIGFTRTAWILQAMNKVLTMESE